MTRFWHVWVATLMASSMLVLPGHASAAAAISPGLAARGYSTQRALTGVEGARFGAWRRAGIAHTAGVGQSIYVSPAGSDRNPGTQLLPFRTLAHAQAVVRTLNRNMLGDINVYLESGTYYLSQSMKLDARDSGTNGYNVIWTAAPGSNRGDQRRATCFWLDAD